MTHFLVFLIFAIFSWAVSGSSAWAQTDLLSVTPSPVPSFLTDHSYDNLDVDGTSLKPEKKTDGSDDLEPIVDPNQPKGQVLESPQSKTKKDAGNSNVPTPTREPDINGL
jgi:hypothetical protein